MEKVIVALRVNNLWTSVEDSSYIIISQSTTGRLVFILNESSTVGAGTVMIDRLLLLQFCQMGGVQPVMGSTLNAPSDGSTLKYCS